MSNTLLKRLCLGLTLSFAGLSSLTWADDQPVATQAPAVRPATWAQSVDPKYNLYQITPTLYRSALPDSDALPVLQKLQIHTAITFLPKDDASWLPSDSIQRVQIPVRTINLSDSQVLTAMRAIQDAQTRGPVLIHCEHGMDRTGAMSAMYRIVVQGWTKEQALDEMENGGYGEKRLMKHAIAYVQNADVDKLRAAMASGACSTSSLAPCAIKGWFKSAMAG